MANYGFDGSFSEAEYAQMWALGGVDAVQDGNAWKVVSGSGRQVTVNGTGWAFAKGVLSKNSGTFTINLATPAAGQWHLIVRRIDWSANTATVVAIPHTATTTTTPTAAPTTYPTVNSTPGTLYDHVLGWAWVNSANTLATVFDLRGVPLVNQATGLIEVSRIPSLNASQIGSGTLDPNRIPSLDAGKTGSGTFALARIPGLPASQVISGVFDLARIPQDDTGWSLTPITLLTTWDTLRDSENTTPSTRGGVRKRNGVVEVRFRCTRNGPTITSSSYGNISPDVAVATLAAPYRPSSTLYATFSVPGLTQGECRIVADGTISITAMYPNNDIPNDGIIQISATYLAG